MRRALNAFYRKLTVSKYLWQMAVKELSSHLSMVLEVNLFVNVLSALLARKFLQDMGYYQMELLL